MQKAIFGMFVVSFLLVSSPAQADPKAQVIKLFDEHPLVETVEAGSDTVVMETAVATIVRGAGDIVILSSTPDGAGIPNLDDFVTINGEFVQSGWFIPAMVEILTGTFPDIPACVVPSETTLDNCFVPHPHFHPVDVSSVIPVGLSTVVVETWDSGGLYGHTELYLVILPKPIQ